MNNKTNKSAAGKATSGKSSSGKSFSGKRSEGRPAAGKPSEGKTAADAPKAPEGAVSRPLFIQATQALSAVLAFDFPADAVLSRHFRDNRELGPRFGGSGDARNDRLGPGHRRFDRAQGRRRAGRSGGRGQELISAVRA